MNPGFLRFEYVLFIIERKPEADYVRDRSDITPEDQTKRKAVNAG